MKCPYCSSYAGQTPTCSQCGGPLRTSVEAFDRMAASVLTGYKIDIRPGAMNHPPRGHEFNYMQTYEVN